MTNEQYAVLTDELRDDHRHVHRYVDFAGQKYLFLGQPCAQYVHTPASISSIGSPEATRLNLATAEEYASIIAHCPPGVAETVKLLIGLVTLRVLWYNW